MEFSNNRTRHGGNEELVISGISGKFPESDNMEEFRDNLYSGVDMVTRSDKRLPLRYFNLPRRMGHLKDLSKFDNSYFGIHGKQAVTIDPQIRILLELTYEAIVDAGVNPEELRGSSTGVVVGTTAVESLDLWSRCMEISGDEFKYSSIGHATSMFSNRISYSFDFKGPSLSVDYACSTSMMALFTAVNLINQGQCDAAIVGASNLCLDPIRSVQFNMMKMLCPDGVIKSFDMKGNGYARAEAICIMFIQKKSVARRIYSNILHITSNCDGFKSEGITYPSHEIQIQLMDKVYKETKIDPSAVEYVEAHGPGTGAGDTEEMQGITQIFCKNGRKGLLVGSVKSNMGHSEAASGFCSLAKVLLIMESGKIPANLHYNEPNKNIPALLDGRVKVVDTLTPYQGGLVSVNSFGFGGANCNLLLKPNMKTKATGSKTCLPQLVTVSGRTEKSVRNFITKIEKAQNDELCGLIRRIHRLNNLKHFHRGYSVIYPDRSAKEFSTYSEQERPVWFVFSGMGSQWPGMGKDLIKFEVFERSLRHSSEVLKPLGIDIYDIVVNGTEKSFDSMTKILPAITAVQIALVDLLFSLGIHPDGLLGHSTGEMATAYADGAFTAEQTILCAFYRGKSFTDANMAPGAMASIGLPWSIAQSRVPQGVFVACDNSANNVSISGPPGPVKEFVKTMQAEGKFAREVDSMNGAFHCKYVLGSVTLLRKYLEKVIPHPKKRSPRWISTSVQESEWNSELAHYCSIDYMVNNLTAPVYFREAVNCIPRNAVVIEIGPHCLFQSILKRSTASKCANIGLVNKRVPDNVEFFLSSVGKMYNAGLQPNVEALYPKVEFPVSRGTPMISSMIEWDHSISWPVKLYQQVEQSVSMYNEVINVSSPKDEYLAGYVMDGTFMFPVSGYMKLVWRALAKLHFKHVEDIPVVISRIKIHRTVTLASDSDTIFHVNILKSCGDFEVFESGVIAASGNITITDDPDSEFTDLCQSDDSVSLCLDSKDIYKELQLRGYEYGETFKNISTIDVKAGKGKIIWRNDWLTFMDNILQCKYITTIGRQFCLPAEIQQIVINPNKFSNLMDGDDVPVQVDRITGIISAGGIKFQGLNMIATSSRKTEDSEPKLEKYTFVPYISNEATTKIKLSYEDALTAALEIVLENNGGIFKFNILEIAGSNKPDDILGINVAKVMLGQPMIYPNVTALVNDISEYVNMEELSSYGVKIMEANSLNGHKFENVHILIGSNLLSEKNEMFQYISKTLNPGSFILVQEFVKSEPVVQDFNIIFSYTTADRKIVLLRKAMKSTSEVNIVNISQNDFKWINNLKVALKESENNGKRVILLNGGDKNSGIVGMVNCLKEEPGGNNIRSFFIKDQLAPKFNLSDPLCREQLKKDLITNIYENKMWGSYRLLSLDKIESREVENAYVDILAPGDLSSLKWVEGPVLSDPNLCNVYYAPVNFKDCMIATGHILRDPQLLDEKMGFEFSGRDKNGGRVMGLVNGHGFATTVIADPAITWKIPQQWTMEQAATVPSAYATAYYTLIVRGQMRSGQSILIHAGAGGVGLAAITIALSMGVTVYTTVGSQEKREFLKKRFSQLSDRHIANSRDTSFEPHIMKETYGRGVDFVLNSLSEDKLQASVRCLAIHGKFLEIGKYDLAKNNSLGMSVFLKNTSFHGIFLDALFKPENTEKNMVMKLISEGLKSGVVQPLPTKLYDKYEVEDAFRYVACGKHIGKVLLRYRDEEKEYIENSNKKTFSAMPKTYFNPEKVYIIAGGLGGYGLELAEWLMTRGAKKIVLTSRYGIRNGFQSLCVSRWEAMGTTVKINTVDSTKEAGALQLIEESSKYGPIGGIFNLALVLSDAFLENQTEKGFEAACAPKINITKNLDKISRVKCPELDYFVTFSSVTSGRGNPGQSNYGFGSSAMERICESRKADKLPGLSIQWGIIGDVGMFMELTGGSITELRGTNQQKISSCLKALDIFLIQQNPVVSSLILASKTISTGSIDKSQASPKDVVAKVLGISNMEDVNANATLIQLGMDSLMLSEIKNTFEMKFDIAVSANEIRNATMAWLDELIKEKEI